MNLLAKGAGGYARGLDALRPLDGVPPLLLRLVLAPVMIQAGWNKLVAFESTARWFGTSLGMPLPEVMAALATGAELLGGVALLLGLATRPACVPLMVTMLVAAFAVHWPNGWLALSDASSWLANERVLEAAPRKAEAIRLLREHGDYEWLTARGRVTILNNGIEFAAMYFVMLLSLFFTGGGRFTSVDHYLGRFFHRRFEAAA